MLRQRGNGRRQDYLPDLGIAGRRQLRRATGARLLRKRLTAASTTTPAIDSAEIDAK
jgi:hypothetical protein